MTSNFQTLSLYKILKFNVLHDNGKMLTTFSEKYKENTKLFTPDCKIEFYETSQKLKRLINNLSKNHSNKLSKDNVTSMCQKIMTYYFDNNGDFSKDPNWVETEDISFVYDLSNLT